MHCSRATLYGCRLSRTCFAREVLQGRDRLSSHSLAETLPGPAPAAPVPTFPLSPFSTDTWDTRIRGCPRACPSQGMSKGPYPAQGSGLHFLDPKGVPSHLLNPPWPCQVLPHSYLGCGLLPRGDGFFSSFLSGDKAAATPATAATLSFLSLSNPPGWKAAAFPGLCSARAGSCYMKRREGSSNILATMRVPSCIP